MSERDGAATASEVTEEMVSKACDAYLEIESQVDVDAMRGALWAALGSAMPTWQPIETAPKDGTAVLVFYDHDADPYYDEASGKLTDYAANAEGLGHIPGRGIITAKWSDGFWDGNEMAGEARYYVPGWWFAWIADDVGDPCNPTHWMPLPAPPSETAARGTAPTSSDIEDGAAQP